MTKTEVIDYLYANNVRGELSIEDMAETISVPQGEWINIDTILFKAQCSVCNTWSNVMGNYCPNCGCRMKGADE